MRTHKSRDLSRIVVTLRELRDAPSHHPELLEYYNDAIDIIMEIMHINTSTRKPEHVKLKVEQLVRKGTSYRAIVKECHVGKNYIYRVKKRFKQQNVLP